MSDVAIAHVEAAIRHRNLSLRVLIGLIVAGAVFAFVVAAVDLWSAEQTVTLATASEGAAQPAWPDLATKALGHFAFAFLIAVLMAMVYETMAFRHLRAIARQVRSGGWLRRGEAISLRRDWIGASDDLDTIVGALNEARAYGIETRSALAWRVGRQRSAEAELRDDLAAATRENEKLRADLSEQADFARLLARDLAISTRLSAANSAGQDVEHRFAADRGDLHQHGISNVLALISPDEAKGLQGAPETIAELSEEFAAYCAASDGRLSRVALSLQEAVDVAVRNLHPRIHGRGAEVEIGDLPVVEGDRALLIRLFSTLIGDALDAAAPGERVQIQIRALASAGDERVVIRVDDNCGWSAMEGRDGDGAAVPAIRSARTWAMCHRIVHAHGGEITEHQSDCGMRSVQIVLTPI